VEQTGIAIVTKTDWPKEPLTPDVMDMLDRVLRDLCSERGVEVVSVEGQTMAKALIDWFEFGVRDEDEFARLAGEEFSVKSP
jgi:hypothetical protein